MCVYWFLLLPVFVSSSLAELCLICFIDIFLKGSDFTWSKLFNCDLYRLEYWLYITDTWDDSQFFQCFDGSVLPRDRVCDGTTDCPGLLAEDESANCREHLVTCLDYWEEGFTTSGVYTMYTGADTSRWISFNVFSSCICVQGRWYRF